jgi:transcriptional regulator with XRE-family HTH domain
MVEKLKRLMKFYNLSQKQLAEKISVTPVAICKVLNGKTKPSIGLALKISEAFNVSLDWLLK